MLCPVVEALVGSPLDNEASIEMTELLTLRPFGTGPFVIFIDVFIVCPSSLFGNFIASGELVSGDVSTSTGIEVDGIDMSGCNTSFKDTRGPDAGVLHGDAIVAVPTRLPSGVCGSLTSCGCC